jgi:hypothetical protein
MKHEAMIRRLLADLHESWMDGRDREAFGTELLRTFGAQLDADIEAGVSNGYSEEQQEAIVRTLFAKHAGKPSRAHGRPVEAMKLRSAPALGYTVGQLRERLSHFPQDAQIGMCVGPTSNLELLSLYETREQPPVIWFDLQEKES